MQILLTETDRRDLTRHAWEAVKRLPLPRKVRLLLRDRMVLRLTPRLLAQRQADLESKWLIARP